MQKSKTVGAPRKYATPAKLKNAVNRYFAQISRTVPATEMVPSGRIDGKGRPIMQPVTVKNDADEIVYIKEYIVKPTIAGLCVYLGISKDTWAEYSHREGYESICAAAKLEMERDRSERLGSGSGDHGIEFDLKYNFGWGETITIEAGDATRKVMAAAAVPMEEKLKLLEEMGLMLPGVTNGEDDRTGV